MPEDETIYSAWRDKVLKLLMDESVKPGASDAGALSHREVMDVLGMTWEQFRPVASYLFEAGYVKGDGMGGPEGGSIWITSPGIEFYGRQRQASPLHIAGNVGAIFHASVQGAQIQAVASAIGASIQQVGQGAQAAEIREGLIQAIEDMVRAVQGQLTVDQLATYTQIAREFQHEVAKENPDQGRLRRGLAILSFLSDAEGAIQLTERMFTLGSHVAPYLPPLLTLLARLCP